MTVGLTVVVGGVAATGGLGVGLGLGLGIGLVGGLGIGLVGGLGLAGGTLADGTQAP